MQSVSLIDKIEATKKNLAASLGIDEACITVSVGEDGVPHVHIGRGKPVSKYNIVVNNKCTEEAEE